jgi:hypothetical protein
MHDLILQPITTNTARTDASLPVTLLLSRDDFEADASRAGMAAGSSFPHGYHQHRTSDRFGEPGQPVVEGANTWSRPVGEGTTAVSVSAVCATMQNV